MGKNFTEWHGVKTVLQKRTAQTFFQEREVWICSVGMNVGHEEDGKRDYFARPVIIFRKFNQDLFWGIPLTGVLQAGSYYHPLEFNGRISVAMLFQMRLWDRKRLLRKVRTVSDGDFGALKGKLKELLPKNEIPSLAGDFSEAEAKVSSV